MPVEYISAPPTCTSVLSRTYATERRPMRYLSGLKTKMMLQGLFAVYDHYAILAMHQVGNTATEACTYLAYIRDSRHTRPIANHFQYFNFQRLADHIHSQTLLPTRMLLWGSLGLKTSNLVKQDKTPLRRTRTAYRRTFGTACTHHCLDVASPRVISIPIEGPF